MARRCTVCDHPEREAIDRAIINSAVFRIIAQEFEVSEAALLRHKKSHIPELLAKSETLQVEKAQVVAEIVQAKAQQDSGQADSLLSRVKALIRNTEAIYAKAEQAEDLHLALKAIKESRGNLELLGKLMGELSDGVTVNLHQSPEWVEVRAVILTTLEPFPEAKEALIRALS